MGELPGLDEPAAAALALVSLVGRTREEIADASDPPGVAELSGEALAEALARGRKALRRSLYPLPGSGWCERAERLISDRLDDALENPGPARLDVHLANCSRCVEHERRLAQSQGSLVTGFVQANPAEQPEDRGASSEPGAAPEDSDAGFPLLRAVETPIPLPGGETEALPSPDTPDDDAVPAAWLRSSATLWSPARPSPPRALSAGTPRPPALGPPPAPVVAALPAPAPPVVPTAAPTVPSTPPPAPPSDPPPSTPSSSWTSQPARTWTPPAETPGVWRGDPARPQPWAHRALENENIWTNVGPLVAALSAAVAIAMLAALLAAGA